MSQVITWRNVTGASPVEAAQPLAAAGQSINNAFNVFNAMLKQQQDLQASNEATAQEAIKQNFLNKLSSAKTPEQLAELQSTGQLDMSGLPVAVQAAVRGAVEARLTSLRQAVTAEQSYNDAQTDRTELPIRDQIAARTAKGDFAGAKALLDEHTLRNEAALYSGLSAAERTKLKQEQEDKTYAHGVKTRDIALENSELTLKETKRKEEEAVESRRIDAVANQFATAYQSSMAGMRSAVQAEADKVGGIPRKKDGSIDDDQMTDAQRKQFDAHLEKSGLPKLTDITTGDTQAAATLRAQLKASGAKPADFARVDALIPSMLSTSPSAALGNDADIISRNIRIQDAVAAENRMKYGVVATPETRAALSG